MTAAVASPPESALSLSVPPPAPARVLFGTDGVRGVANTELSPQLALALGAAAAGVLKQNITAGSRPHVVVGRDPRISGDALEAALAAGFCALGVDVLRMGVVPTPVVAFVTRERNALAGVMVSASHNPVQDNGIKFFGPNGRKLSDALEARIEAALPGWEDAPRPLGASVGRFLPGGNDAALAGYEAHLRACCSRRLDGLRIVVDGANGAAYDLAPRVLGGLGAILDTLSCDPDGVNINENCGSTHPRVMAERVRETSADAGLAFDGDADRVILADHRGRIVDGDRVLCLAGIYLASQNRLPGGIVVGTDYSNLGLEQALARHNLRLVRAKTGDRYVAEKMAERGAAVGGEKSGHLLFADHTTTGDGLLTALIVLNICRESGRRLADWADEMTELPQTLQNVRVTRKEGWRDIPEVADSLARAEAALAGRGRIFVRPSGTEKMIRVMAEGEDQAEIEALAGAVADALRAHLGA